MAESVKARQRVERSIIRRAILDALHAGYTLNVNNGGDTHELEKPSGKCKDILGAMFATDDEHLIYYKDGKRVGWAYFVHGNGWCVLSDHSTNLEAVLKGASDLADKYA
jgi:hypothetical protein